jgi:hypothetical protein
LVFAHCSGPPKNGQVHICINFRKVNATTKKDPYPLPFMEELLDMVTKHKVYHFWIYFRLPSSHDSTKDWYKIAFITKWGAFMWLIMLIKLKNAPPTYQWTFSMAFKEYFGLLMKLFFNDFNVFNDLKTHLAKLLLCFSKCREFGISLNPKKCIFLVFFGVILDHIMSKEGKLLDPKKL